MRLDHIAYRVKHRYKTAKFFEDTLGYTIGTEFQIEFDDGSTADCLALWDNEEMLIYREGQVTDRYRLDGMPLGWLAHPQFPGLLCVEQEQLVMKKVEDF